MNLSLYLHIPFCVEKCRYCDFVSFPSSSTLIPRYLDTLISEIRSEAPLIGDSPVIGTVYFGGGTPSLLTPMQVELLMEQVVRSFRLLPDVEVTMEVNPGTVSAESLHGYRQAGINRLSIGIQSLDDGLLGLLGRIHSRRDALRTYDDARRAGFDAISLDLIHSIPGMDPAIWRSTLVGALSLHPDHLSAYALTPEWGTPLGSAIGEGIMEMPDDDLSADMFALTDELCEREGLYRYEISNHARPGCESRHNIRYWIRAPYLGCGVAAHSLLPLAPWGTRFSRTEDLAEYIRLSEQGLFPRLNIHDLSRMEAAQETLFLGLRMTEGVDRHRFRSLFGCDPTVMFPAIWRLCHQGAIILTEDRIRVSPAYVYRSNLIFSQFV